ncbi:MAG: serine hydrolase domain-containing protein [Gammaproteobacteria bacterium]|nr:serine hydrolase domain-containing protein [Gammaproteobacteria bacterium]
MRTVALTLLAFFHLAVAAAELPYSKPAAAGFSPERFERVSEVTRRAVENGTASGVVTLVSRHGRIIYDEAIGTMGLDNEAPMRRDSLFRIYSMTKAVTAVAALMLYEEGHFQLYDPVSRYLPEFAEMQVYENGKLRSANRPITIHHLLTHTSGLSYGYPIDHPALATLDAPDIQSAGDLATFSEYLAQYPLLFEPGTDWEYSFATDVLGALVEELSGQSLGAFFEARIFEPLNMSDTGFAVQADKIDRLTTLHTWDSDTASMTAIDGPPFPTPYRVSPIDAGGGGLISTARDYMRFLEMLRNGGTLQSQRILGPKTITFMMKDHLPRSITASNTGPDADLMLGLGASHALGIGIYADPVARGVLSSPGELEWGGAAGTIYWWDPVEDIVVVIMRQLRSSPDSLRLRDDMSVAIYQALLDVSEESSHLPD